LTAPVSRRSTSLAAWVVAALLPLIGLVSLLARSKLDPHYDNHKVHFVLFLTVAAVDFVLAYSAGDAAHRRNLISSIFLSEAELEAHNRVLVAKYNAMEADESRAEIFQGDDADVLLVACNTPARIAKGAVKPLRAMGIRAGLFRPVTLWPFPMRQAAPLVTRARRLVVVEASPGQLEDEFRLAASHADVRLPLVQRVNRFGGMLPSQDEIIDCVGRSTIEAGRPTSLDRPAGVAP